MERMTRSRLPRRIPLVALIALAAGCAANPNLRKATPDAEKPWSVRMAESVVARHPEAAKWETDAKTGKGKYTYATAFAAYAVMNAGLKTGDSKLIEYGKNYADAFIDENGKFKPKVYKPKDYKLDDVLPGRLFLLSLKHTSEPRYRVAADALIEQLKTQPRTNDGGFWHKKTYSHEMWLDGIYMDCPFMAEYAQVANQPQWMDEAARQIFVIAAHTRDPGTGLFYHGWDESKSERWANKQTGTSPNFWGRAVGWYAMGIVDTLERLPRDHPRRAAVEEIFRGMAGAITRVQDPQTGLWWQVLDQGGRKGNYLESSASCMFVYALAKGVRLGVIEAKYDAVAKKGYAGILERFVWEDERGKLALTDTCQVAGLGGDKKYRDGSYNYYLSEKRVSNDPKGIAPFILAAMEIEQR
jgi:unsaturated rhamnogalacturonyl hydrolase